MRCRSQDIQNYIIYGVSGPTDLNHTVFALNQNVESIVVFQRGNIEEDQVVVKRRSLIVSLVYGFSVRLVCPDAAVCTLSVLPTRGTLQ